MEVYLPLGRQQETVGIPRNDLEARARVEEVHHWLTSGLPLSLEDDPSGFIAGLESAGALDRLEAVCAYLRDRSGQ